MYCYCFVIFLMEIYLVIVTNICCCNICHFIFYKCKIDENDQNIMCASTATFMLAQAQKGSEAKQHKELRLCIAITISFYRLWLEFTKFFQHMLMNTLLNQ